jgi:hypothetical protein
MEEGLAPPRTSPSDDNVFHVCDRRDMGPVDAASFAVETSVMIASTPMFTLAFAISRVWQKYCRGAYLHSGGICLACPAQARAYRGPPHREIRGRARGGMLSGRAGWMV